MTLKELRAWIAGDVPAPPPPAPLPDRDGAARVILTSVPLPDGTIEVHVDFTNATGSALAAMNLYADCAPTLQRLVREELTRQQSSPEPTTTFGDAARNAGRAG